MGAGLKGFGGPLFPPHTPTWVCVWVCGMKCRQAGSKEAPTPQSPRHSLLNANLPVELPSDGGPVDLPLVQAVVHTPEDDCSAVLGALLAAGGRRGRRVRSGYGRGVIPEGPASLQAGAP